MPPRATLPAALLLAAAAGVAAVSELPDSVMEVVTASGEVHTFLAMRATFGSNGRVLQPLTLVDATTTAEPFGCTEASLPPRPPGVWNGYVAYLVARGNCTFAEKAVSVQGRGGSAVIIADAIPGMYLAGNASALWAPTCDYDCSAGMGTIPGTSVSPATADTGYPGQCGGPDTCGSGLCLLTQPDTDTLPLAPGAPRTACCLVSDYMAPGADAAAAAGITVGVFYATTNTGLDASALVSAGGGKTVVRLYARPISQFPWASALLWGLGVTAVALASWRSGEWERAALVAAAAGHERPAAGAVSPAAATPPVALSWRAGCILMAFAGTVLLTLFVLVRYGVDIVYFMIAIFALGASTSTYNLVTLPAVTAYLPAALRSRALLRIRVGGGCTQSVGATVAAAAALLPVVVWVAWRNADWAWVLNDALAIILCCGVLLNLKLASARAITILFTLFFGYDIFMVFLTPYIFGSSVMLDVATAGIPQPPAATPDWACYCREHPDDTRSCGAGEMMPILLRVPRIGDYRGGYAMLGLGDIVIPGILLSFALRLDLSLKLLRRRRDGAAAGGASASAIAATAGNGGGSGGAVARWCEAVTSTYWPTTVVGYAMGLAAANLAVSLMRMGQPALLYLCPATLLPVLALAYWRGDLGVVWRGAATLNMHGGDSDSDGVVTAAGDDGDSRRGGSGGGSGRGGAGSTEGGGVVAGSAGIALTAADHGASTAATTALFAPGSRAAVRGTSAGGGVDEESTPLRAAAAVDGGAPTTSPLP